MIASGLEPHEHELELRKDGLKLCLFLIVLTLETRVSSAEAGAICHEAKRPQLVQSDRH